VKTNLNSDFAPSIIPYELQISPQIENQAFLKKWPVYETKLVNFLPESSIAST
jgi:hypothetical protein